MMTSPDPSRPHFNARLHALADDFDALDTWQERHQYVCDLGRTRATYPEEKRTADALVPGCLSKVWMFCNKRDANLVLRIDAESAFVQGLAALLMKIFDDLPLAEAAVADEAFLDRLGLLQNVTPTRATALRNLVRKIRAEARRLLGAGEESGATEELPPYVQRFSGLHRLYPTSPADKLRRAHVCVVGIGGVGTWVVEALARSGVGTLTLVDQDDVSITNTNRQLHATVDTVGRPKVQAMAERVRAINPECEVRLVSQFFSEETCAEIFASPYDFVVDAIDGIPAKCLLVAECRRRGIPIVVSGGAGGKHNPAAVRTGDLGTSSNDALLKSLKKRLRQFHGVEPADGHWGVSCVYSIEPPHQPWKVCGVPVEANARLNCSGGLGSATFVTGVFGFFMASIVVNTLAAT